ncbi:MAG: hypothetical protein M3Y31_05655 [Gemmatimonadota bacterium]|nr:hypothetical protein [Gemmatimonadota bacterium]
MNTFARSASSICLATVLVAGCGSGNDPSGPDADDLAGAWQVTRANGRLLPAELETGSGVLLTGGQLRVDGDRTYQLTLTYDPTGPYVESGTWSYDGQGIVAIDPYPGQPADDYAISVALRGDELTITLAAATLTFERSAGSSGLDGGASSLELQASSFKLIAHSS